MIDCKNPRGKISDNDIVTFSVFVNQVDRGHGAGFFTGMAGASPGFPSGTPAAAVTPNTRSGMSKDWIVGPLEIAPGDIIHVVYSGSNTSDSELDLSGQAELQLKILDTITSAAVGAVGGVVGSAVATVLGLIGDPVGKFLGFSPQGPCNGLVFSDAVEFSGAGLDSLAFHPPTVSHSYVSLPNATEFSFTRPYTDEASHDTGICGEVAHYEITFSVLRVPFISVRYYARRLFPKHWEGEMIRPDFSQGLRQLAPPGAAVSIRSLLQLRP